MQAINERCQKSQRPNYTFKITSSGPSHQPQFTAVCVELPRVVGIGATKKAAKEECARWILDVWDADDKKKKDDKKTKDDERVLEICKRRQKLEVEERALEMFTPGCEMHICPYPTSVRDELVFLDVHYDAIQKGEFVCAQVFEPPNRITLFSKLWLLYDFLSHVKKVVAFESSPICPHIRGMSYIIDRAEAKKNTLGEMAHIHLGKYLNGDDDLRGSFSVEQCGQFTIKQLTYLCDRVACLGELFAKLNAPKTLM